MESRREVQMEDRDLVPMSCRFCPDFLKSVPDSKGIVSTVRRDNRDHMVSCGRFGQGFCQQPSSDQRYAVYMSKSLRAFLSELSAEESLEQFDIGRLWKRVSTISSSRETSEPTAEECQA